MARHKRINDLPARQAQKQLNRVFERDKGICGMCNTICSRKDASREHVVPLKDGGSRSDSNVILAHKGCNYFKGQMDDDPEAMKIKRQIKACIARQRNGHPITATRQNGEGLFWEYIK